jgi:hypothetical protein
MICDRELRDQRTFLGQVPPGPLKGTFDVTPDQSTAHYMIAGDVRRSGGAVVHRRTSATTYLPADVRMRQSE